MREWTESPALRGHMEAVAACMGLYAERIQPGEGERWSAAVATVFSGLPDTGE